MLPSELHERAARYAARRRISLGHLIRSSLQTAIEQRDEAPERDPLWADDEVFRGRTPRDLARHHDRHLESD